MLNKVVLFGAGQFAEVARYYLEKDSSYEIAGYTLDREFFQSDEFGGLPVVPFDIISERFPPDDHLMFIPISYTKLNTVRQARYEQAKTMGYRFASYLSSKAWVWEEFVLSENCLIMENNVLQPYTSIGNNCILWSGNHIGHHTKIGDHCFFASHTVTGGSVEIGNNCFVGVNATIRDNVRIGERCVIGAGALILGDAEPDGVYMGSATERSRVSSDRIRAI